jgi:hypothetical protein
MVGHSVSSAGSMSKQGPSSVNQDHGIDRRAQSRLGTRSARSRGTLPLPLLLSGALRAAARHSGVIHCLLEPGSLEALCV